MFFGASLRGARQHFTASEGQNPKAAGCFKGSDRGAGIKAALDSKASQICCLVPQFNKRFRMMSNEELLLGGAVGMEWNGNDLILRWGAF